jgi:hypothetical protein
VELLLRLTAGLDYSQDVICSGHFFPNQHHNVPPGVGPATSGRPGWTRTHMTPTEAIAEGVLTLAQYNSYQNFVMVRDPLDRMISAHSLGFRRDTFDVAAIIRDRVIGQTHFSIFKPQVEWLTEGNMNIMPFSDYVNSVTTILTAFGAPIPVDLPNITRRHPEHETFTRSIATPADRTAIGAPGSPYEQDAQLNY